MGTEATTDDDDRRWAEALALLSGSPNAALEQRVRRRRQKFWLIFIAVLIAALVLPFLVVLLRPGSSHNDSGDRSPSDPLWAGLTSLSCSLVGLTLIVAGIVQMRRAGLWGGRWQAPTSVLTRSQRRNLLRQILGRTPVQAYRLPLLRDMAGRMTKQRPMQLVSAGIVIQQVGSLPPSPSARRVAFVVALAFLYLIANVQAQRRARLAKRLLAIHDPG